MHPALPISRYGLIGNCRTAALISDQGSIEWACFPHFDSDSYFAALLDRDRGGHFTICPSLPFTSRQTYVPDSNVLETIFETPAGKLRLTDCFTATTEHNKHRRFISHCEILRKIEAIGGDLTVDIIAAPKPHYSSHGHDGKDRGPLGLSWGCGHDDLRLLSGLPSSAWQWSEKPGGHEARAQIVLKAGESRFLSLIYDQSAPAILPALGQDAEERLSLTLQFWRNWIQQCKYEGPNREHVRRSALALKLMTFAPSGAIVAAPTTSLPEAPGGVRNWDYRFAWLRDSAFAVRALLRLGFTAEAHAHVNWMIDSAAGKRGRYQVMYSLFGSPTPKERELPWFSGYQGASPVRVGNGAKDQFQLDIFGEILDSALLLSKSGERFDKTTSRFLLDLGQQICRRWREPDDGIWEPRVGRQHHVHSLAMSWAGLDRLQRLGHTGAIARVPHEKFGREARAIREMIETRGYDSQLGSYMGTLTEDISAKPGLAPPAHRDLDASVLQLPLIGYCSPTGKRMAHTLRAIRGHLARGELVYRYLGKNDGLPDGEGCFGVCSFWMIDALAKSGEIDEAEKLFSAFLGRANSTGLWPEEIDAFHCGFLGNYPQAFTHIGLINSALTLQETRIQLGQRRNAS